MQLMTEIQVIFIRHSELMLISVLCRFLALFHVPESIEVLHVGREGGVLRDRVGGRAEVGEGGEVNAGRESEGLSDDAVEANWGEWK